MMHSFDIIEPGYVINCNFKDLASEIVKANRLSHRFRILRIYNCENWDLVKKKLIDDEITALLEKCSYLLILILEFNNCEGQEFCSAELDLIVPARSPFIINLVCRYCENAEIFFMESQFEIQQVDEENPPMWIQHLNRIAKKPVKTNLLTVELIKERAGYVNAFVELGSALTIRFVTLFDEPKDELDWDRIQSSLNSHKIENFLAALDFPIFIDDPETLTEKLTKWFKQVDKNNNNLLELAVENDNAAVVNGLLNFGFDLDTAADRAWKLGFSDCLLLLIKADARFPEGFDLEKVNDRPKKKFNRLLRSRKEFHEAAMKKDIEKIENFVTKHPKLQHAFNEHNHSVLTVALKNKNFEAYALLLSHGFSTKSDNILSETMKMLSMNDQTILRDILRQSFQSCDEPHVLQLILKSKLAVGNDSKNFANVASAFRELNSIAEVSPILKLAAQAENLQIVFDFGSTSIKQMDPTKSEYCRGTFYRASDIIYVAAEFFHTCYAELLGTLAHELTHFAILLVYDNFCLPYANENGNKNKYEAAFGEAREYFSDNRSSVEPVVRDSFDCYNGGFLQQVELIVRVPQLAAMFSKDPNRVNNSKSQFPKLFSFFAKILEDIEEKLITLHLTKDDNEINNLVRKRKLVDNEDEKKSEKLLQIGMANDMDEDDVGYKPIAKKRISLQCMMELVSENSTIFFLKFGTLCYGLMKMTGFRVIPTLLKSFKPISIPEQFKMVLKKIMAQGLKLKPIKSSNGIY